MITKYQAPKKNQATKVSKQKMRARQERRTLVHSLPAAYAMSASSNTKIRQNRDGSATLVVQEIFQIQSERNGLTFMLPANPTKWIGTRAQQLSATYTSFRPLSFEIGYCPVTGTSTSGFVAVGTVFDGARIPSGSDQDLARSLSATNGGFITTMWQPASRRVALGKNLRANTFPLYDVQDDDIPFWVVASGSQANQGFIVIRCRMTLHNPALAAISPMAVHFEVYGASATTGGYVIKGNVPPNASLLKVGEAVTFKLGQALNSLTPIMKSIVGVIKSIASGTIEIFLAGVTEVVALNTLAFIFLRTGFPAELPPITQ